MTIAHPTSDIESLFGDPYDIDNPLGAHRIVEADERDEILVDAENALLGAGFDAHFVPADLGGRFESVPALVDTLRPVFARDAALGLGYGITTFMAALNVYAAGDGRQKREIADSVLAGNKISVAYHELDHGNDFTSNECAAVQDEDILRLRGGKQLINNIERAHSAVVFARTDRVEGPRAHSLFLVPLDDPVIDRTTRYRTLGLRGCRLGGVDFGGVSLLDTDRIGARGAAVEIALRSFQVSRCIAAGAALGPVDEALFLVLKFARERCLYGRRLVELPHARAVLGDAFVDLLVAEAIVRETARALHTSPAGAGALCAATKYLVPRMLEDTMRSLSVLLGARFYLRRGPYAMFGKHFRDIPALAIGHAGGVSCQLTILSQLARITRLDGADLPDSDTADVLPPVRFDELALVGRSADPMLLGLRARLDPVDDIDRALAHALGQLSHGARALGPAATGVATTPSALRLTERYALLVAAGAVTLASDGKDAWARRAKRRLVARLYRQRIPAPDDGTVLTELLGRAEHGRAFDLAARPVARRLP
ncbi:acyl-CoA dehydrogenase [Rhodococcus pyridinivorans]|uniref:acyl-CoA dehydrogenase n=1 Tax=Rhodococcus pyridinivorans TaxID=103816 RepID=UPI001E3C6FF6|nr:acyl-CoA dehydrogenase [Rhodococcus pyridinivorans]UGQ57586.1 acyl-CoA dehydrogenase [Rhodococcus pyridinivorans]